MSQTNKLPIAVPKVLVFDLMGTCLDWQSSIVYAIACHCPSAFSGLSSVLSDGLQRNDPDEFAMQWRMGFFTEIQRRFEAGEPEEDIDATHRSILDRLLREWKIEAQVDDDARKAMVESWHNQTGWEEVSTTLELLKKEFFLVVLANGTTRLQLDLVQSSGLPFHMLFSSELLQKTKPDPNMYLKAMGLMRFKPSECLMIAAHAYDLRVAKQVGMSTAYIQRRTEDPHENMEKVKSEVDIFIPLNETESKDDTGLALLGNMLMDAKWGW